MTISPPAQPLQPWPHQLDAVRAIGRRRHSGSDRALVVMAPGTGKTLVTALAAQKYLAERPQARVLYLCHQNELLAQARRTFTDVLGPEVTHGFFHGDEKNLHEVTCLYASFQAMAGWREAFHRNEFELVVVDESHHGQAPTYRSTLEYFTPEFLLGVTAIPDRADLKDIRKLFGPETYSLPLERALGEGLLTPVDYRLITDEMVDVGSMLTSRGRLTMRQLNRELFAPKRDAEILRLLQEKSAEVPAPRAIGFCQNIAQADRFAGAYPNALAVHSGLTREEQQQRLTAFRSGRVSTLFTVDMFNEGLDVPEANLIFFLRSTASRAVFLQQLGRGLRPLPGKDKVVVLDLVGNCERLMLIQDLRREVEGHLPVSVPQSAPPLAVAVGTVEFNEVRRDVFEVLAEIRGGHSREVLVRKLQELARDLGRTPGTQDVRATPDMPALGAYLTMFGRWHNAVVAAGLQPLRWTPAPQTDAVLSPAGAALLDAVRQRYGTGRNAWGQHLARGIEVLLSAPAGDPWSATRIEALDLAALPSRLTGEPAKVSDQLVRAVRSAARLYEYLHPGVLGSEVPHHVATARMPSRGRPSLSPAGTAMLAAVKDAYDGGRITQLQFGTYRAAIRRVLNVPAGAPAASPDIRHLDPEQALRAANWAGVQSNRRTAVTTAFRAACKLYDAEHPGTLGADLATVPTKLAPAGHDLLEGIEAALQRGMLTQRQAVNLRGAVRQHLEVPTDDDRASLTIARLDVPDVVRVAAGKGVPESTSALFAQAANVYDATRPDYPGSGDHARSLSPAADAWLRRRALRLDRIALTVGAELPDRLHLPPAAWDLLHVLAEAVAEGKVDRPRAGYLSMVTAHYLGTPAGDPRTQLRIADLDVGQLLREVPPPAGASADTGKAYGYNLRRMADLFEEAHPGALGANLALGQARWNDAASQLPAPTYAPVRRATASATAVLAPAASDILAVLEDKRRSGELTAREASSIASGVRRYLRAEPGTRIAELRIEDVDLAELLNRSDLPPVTKGSNQTLQSQFRRACEFFDEVRPGVLGSARRVLAPAGAQLLSALAPLAENGTLEVKELRALRRAVHGYLTFGRTDPRAGLRIEALDPAALIAERRMTDLSADSALRYRTGLLTAAEIFDRLRPGVLGSALPERPSVLVNAHMRRRGALERVPPTAGPTVLPPAGEALVAVVQDSLERGALTPERARDLRHAVRSCLAAPADSADATVGIEQLDLAGLLKASATGPTGRPLADWARNSLRAAARLYEAAHPGQLGRDLPNRLVFPGSRVREVTVSPAASALLDTVADLESQQRISPVRARRLRLAVRTVLASPADAPVETTSTAEAVARVDWSRFTPSTRKQYIDAFRDAVRLYEGAHPGLWGRDVVDVYGGNACDTSASQVGTSRQAALPATARGSARQRRAASGSR